MMTKKNEEELVWRLKERPTAHEVCALVANNIITEDEAKKIIFETKTDN